MHEKKDFLPALPFRVLLPVYDAGIALTMPERRFKTTLLDAARIEAGQRVLDAGCGTGTLLLWAAQRHPDALFCGLDPDPVVLARARRKLARIGRSVELKEGSATALPYADGSFDRVLSTLMVHHLSPDAKLKAFEEIYRVLVPGGEFHVGDFGAPHNGAMRLISAIVARLGHEHVDENFAALLPPLIGAAGFAVSETAIFASLFGTIRLLRAVKAGG